MMMIVIISIILINDNATHTNYQLILMLILILNKIMIIMMNIMISIMIILLLLLLLLLLIMLFIMTIIMIIAWSQREASRQVPRAKEDILTGFIPRGWIVITLSLYL